MRAEREKGPAALEGVEPRPWPVETLGKVLPLIRDSTCLEAREAPGGREAGPVLVLSTPTS